MVSGTRRSARRRAAPLARPDGPARGRGAHRSGGGPARRPHRCGGRRPAHPPARAGVRHPRPVRRGERPGGLPGDEAGGWSGTPAPAHGPPRHRRLLVGGIGARRGSRRRSAASGRPPCLGRGDTGHRRGAGADRGGHGAPSPARTPAPAAGRHPDLDPTHDAGSADRAPGGPELRPLPTVAVGLAGGVLVGMTSVGSGSLMLAGLTLLYPGLGTPELVGTDLVQAVPLVGTAALAHLLMGDVRLALTGALLAGALPGAFVGARLSSRSSGRLVRPALAVLLLATGLRLLWV